MAKAIMQLANRDYHSSAAMLFTQNDYMVRVYMNDLILRLDKDNDKHAVLAKEIMDYLLEEMNNENFKAFQFLSTIEHRTKVCIAIIRYALSPVLMIFSTVTDMVLLYAASKICH